MSVFNHKIPLIDQIINKDYWKYLFLLILIIFPLFMHLGSIPIRTWDESRLAMNAYDMYKNGNYLVTHYDGYVETWNTKPPIMIWCQVFFMKILGPTELALRLPSAIAALATCIALLVFSLRYLKSFWFGFITVLILVTSTGYVDLHSTRSGDYDSLLTLFTTLSCFSIFAYTETSKKKYIYWFFAFITLGVLTKSIAALLFTPGIFIYILIRKQLLPLLKNKHTCFGLLSFIVIVLRYLSVKRSSCSLLFKSSFEKRMGWQILKST